MTKLQKAHLDLKILVLPKHSQASQMVDLPAGKLLQNHGLSGKDALVRPSTPNQELEVSLERAGILHRLE